MYLATLWREIAAIWPFVAVAVVGVVVGTAVGTPVLARMPQRYFRTILSVLLIALGGYMMLRGGR